VQEQVIVTHEKTAALRKEERKTEKEVMPERSTSKTKSIERMNRKRNDHRKKEKKENREERKKQNAITKTGSNIWDFGDLRRAANDMFRASEDALRPVSAPTGSLVRAPTVVSRACCSSCGACGGMSWGWDRNDVASGWAGSLQIMLREPDVTRLRLSGAG